MELARRAGVSPSYVSLIEHGEKIPSEDVAVRIARVLDEREDLYRIWAVTARMDARTRDAVLRLRGSESALGPLLSGNADAFEAALSMLPEIPAEPTPRSTLPPPLARTADEHDATLALYDEDALAGALLVPLLAPRAAPSSRDLQNADVERVLALDGRIIGRPSSAGLVAVRVDETNGARVSTWLRIHDLVVIDREPARFDSALIHAFRLGGSGLELARGNLAGTTLLVLADPSHPDPPEALEVSEPGRPGDRLFGTVIWSARRY